MSIELAIIISLAALGTSIIGVIPRLFEWEMNRWIKKTKEAGP